MDISLLFCLVITRSLLLDVLCQDSPRYWNNQAEKDLKQMRDVKENTNIAKNIIFIVGDGMGVSTVTAGRILKGQQRNGKNGEEHILNFEKFDNIGLLKTYNVDYRIPDSAGTATAYLCGVKAKRGTVGLDGRVDRYNCALQKGREVKSIMDWAQEAGKSVGIVTTARVTHASPAANYAHSADRDWEGDSELTDEAISNGCRDVARQLITENPNIQVILGGGRKFFRKTDHTGPEPKTGNHSIGLRKDMDLVEYWKNDKKRRNLTHKYVWNTEGFESIDAKNTDHVLGLFSRAHMSFELDRDTGPKGEPSLADMTKKAIEILQKNDKGFYLFLESGKIDTAHHENRAKKALYETMMLDDAVKVVTDMTNEKDTLVMVTADHSHGFVIQGSSLRNTNLLGHSLPSSSSKIARDTILGTTLMYINGPGHRYPRKNFTTEQVLEKDFRQDSIYWLVDSTHSAEDVAVYAQGPMSHLIRRTHEQNYVAHVMAYSACIGRYKDDCDRVGQENGSSSSTFRFHRFLFALLVLLKLL